MYAIIALHLYSVKHNNTHILDLNEILHLAHIHRNWITSSRLRIANLRTTQDQNHNWRNKIPVRATHQLQNTRSLFVHLPKRHRRNLPTPIRGSPRSREREMQFFMLLCKSIYWNGNFIIYLHHWTQAHIQQHKQPTYNPHDEETQAESNNSKT